MVSKSSSTFGPRRRAVSGDMKQHRRRDLLDAALGLLGERPYESITMGEVAAAAGVAKGTTYLYFPTKETLFLHLLTEHYLGWFDALDAVLQQPLADLDQWADAMVREFTRRPLFLRLVAVLHVVLERNVPVSEIVAFKRQLAERVLRSGEALEHGLQLPPASGRTLLLWLQAIVPGLAQMAAPPPALHAALRAAPDLSGFLIDFPTELRQCLLAVVRGLRVQAETSR